MEYTAPLLTQMSLLLLLKRSAFCRSSSLPHDPSLISRLRRAGAPLLFVAALCFGAACDHDAPTPQPDPICPEPEQWQPAAAGRYEARVRYSCDCRDEAQLVLTAAPAVDDTLRMPAVRRHDLCRQARFARRRLHDGAHGGLSYSRISHRTQLSCTRFAPRRQPRICVPCATARRLTAAFPAPVSRLRAFLLRFYSAFSLC